MYHIYRKKIVLLFLACFAFAQSYGQGGNNLFSEYSRRIHFGFFVGTNVSDFKYDFSPAWYAQSVIHRINIEHIPGITIGAVSDLHFGEYFHIRFLPSLILTQRNVIYTVTGDSVAPKQVESAIVEFPVLLKLASERHTNVAFYVIGGGKFGWDLSSDYKAVKNPINPKLALLPPNYSYEFGAGLDMYFPLFKFSPEIKLSRGINNVLFNDNTIYTNIFSRFRSNVIFFTFYFEG